MYYVQRAESNKTLEKSALFLVQKGGWFMYGGIWLAIGVFRLASNPVRHNGTPYCCFYGGG
jgi:hypothetical protein